MGEDGAYIYVFDARGLRCKIPKEQRLGIFRMFILLVSIFRKAILFPVSRRVCGTVSLRFHAPVVVRFYNIPAFASDRLCFPIELCELVIHIDTKALAIL